MPYSTPPIINQNIVGTSGIALNYHKIGTASEAIGVRYSWQKDSGFPGAYSLGSPGVNGWWVPAILVTGATTNVGAITNTTLSYTDSDGNAGNTATIASFPATAVVGTLVPFQLAAGDRGVRSIESITLGTSYAGGSISLVLLRKLASIPNPVANVGGIMNKLVNEPTGTKIFNGTALFLSYMSSATTATTLSGTIQVVGR